MPQRPPRSCAEPGCPALAYGGPRCEKHRQAYEERLAARRDYGERYRSHDREYDRGRGTAAARGYGAEWRPKRARFLAAHPTCICGQPAQHVHHLRARRDGGTDEWSNLVALCSPCHNRVEPRSGVTRRGPVTPGGQGRGGRISSGFQGPEGAPIARTPSANGNPSGGA